VPQAVSEATSRRPRPFKKVLVANRGEIALRIIRALREQGITSLLPFSDLDCASLPVKLADQVIPLPGRSVAETYLRGDRLIEIALSHHCQAIHPGYGFLAENADFASQVAHAGLTFIGPPPKAIALMGSKTAARTLLRKAGIPLGPWGSRKICTIPPPRSATPMHWVIRSCSRPRPEGRKGDASGPGAGPDGRSAPRCPLRG